MFKHGRLIRFSSSVLSLVSLASLASLTGCGEPGSGNVGFLDEAYTQQCPMQTVEGVDVFDGQGAITWSKVKGAGREFAFIKATQGDTFIAKTFAANWVNSKAAGVIRSPYHFFDPSIDGIKQANHFLAVLKTLEAGDLPAMLDIECPTSANQAAASPNCEYQGNSGWAPPAVITQRIFDWLDTVEKATGKKPIIYSYPAWFGDVMQTDVRLAQYPLFIATLANCASVPAPWTKTLFWQYSFTGTVAGINGQVDLDRFMGSLAQLQAFANMPATFGDGGVPGDAGVKDAAMSTDLFINGDASMKVDAAMRPDLSMSGDAAVEVDAATSVDAAMKIDFATGKDAGAKMVDAAVNGGGGGASSGGCGCRIDSTVRGQSRSAMSIVLLLGLGLVLRRRRTAGQPV